MRYSYEDEHRYDSIITLPHHVSTVHPQMNRMDRAAQFAPFAALTGYGAAVDEAARLTEEEFEPGEDSRLRIDARLRLAAEHIKEKPILRVTWFRPDERKAGGAYVDTEGAVKKISAEENLLIFSDGTVIRIDAITDLDGELFRNMEF